jgi:hypothetical protein
MKLIKSLMIAGAVLVAAPAFSQLSIGAQGTYLKFLGGMSDYDAFPGAGLKAEFELNSGIVVSGGFSYFLKNSYEYSITAEAADLSTAEISLTQNTNAMFFNVDGKYYFAGAYDDDYGFYANVGVGYMMVPVSVEVGDYDKEKYQVLIENSEETSTNLMIGIGVGFEALVGPVYIFGEGRLNIPPTEANGVAVAIDVSGSAAVNIGVRFPLDF